MAAGGSQSFGGRSWLAGGGGAGTRAGGMITTKT
jgi:hypothetical protein